MRRLTPAARTRIALLVELRALRDMVRREGEALVAEWESRSGWAGSRDRALNLAYYIVLRRQDLRPMQDQLMLLGLSSLGRLEARVLANLEAVIASLAAIVDDPHSEPFPSPAEMWHGRELNRANADVALGPCRSGRSVRLMVTLPSEAAADPAFARKLLEEGADIVRINCAHDSPETWRLMIANIRQAAGKRRRSIPVLMDLAGPRCRTAEVLCAKGHKRLNPGDEMLFVTGEFQPREQWPVQARCTLPGALIGLRPGASVCIDEGRVGARVLSTLPQGVLLKIETTPPRGMRLKPDKGLNFPDTPLAAVSLTPGDLQALDFVAHNADLVGYSFVQTADDISLLQHEIEARVGLQRAKSIGIVAKIETALAVRNLPGIIVQGVSRQPFAIMIARGDLGVEIGFERLAEMQEEILWLCEAAFVPVIWATGVLHGLIKEGQPNRGEMTDAAMSARAECVMLNKGPYVLEALRCLDRLFGRMAEHQEKKTPRLRALRSW